MKITRTDFDGLLIVEPTVYKDSRGHFVETWKESCYKSVGLSKRMVQDNLSWSRRGVLRGLHFQHPRPQEKLVHVLAGEVFDVVVDVRQGSPTFGKWFATRLSDQNKCQLYIPAGLAHGFCVLSDAALVAYKCTEEYCRDTERSLAWNDPRIAIDWPIKEPILSSKDQLAPLLEDIPSDHLPDVSRIEMVSLQARL
jgi:dTDP-4-dehydrorhamnose 3,5-epimerase